MTDTQILQAEVLPAPADFPVQWGNPADAAIFWSPVRMQFPRPATPLEFSLVVQPIIEGLNRAAKTYALPIRHEVRHINTYVYEGIVPAAFAAGQEPAGDAPVQDLYAAIETMRERWEGEWLPEVKTHLASWESFDLSGASLPALLDHLKEAMQRFTRMWEIHFLLWNPMYLAMSLYDELFLEVVDTATPADAYQLLAGVETTTSACNQMLWTLSRQALASPAVCEMLAMHETADVLALLRGSPDGQAFLAGLDEFLRGYGKRSDSLQLRDRSWLEDPSPALTSIRGYLAQPDRDLAAEMKGIAENSAQQVAKIREQMQFWPQSVVESFETLLAAAQAGYALSEDHNYWIDSQSVYHMRQIVLECGRRLAQAGLIETPDDVFFLTRDELQHAAGADADSAAWQERIQERRRLVEHFAAIMPPVIGAPPSMPGGEDPMTRLVGKFFGRPLPPAETPGEIRGHAGSPGVVQGRARVVLSLAEADKLEPGDILVTITTILPWTSLFANISALVTDSGGILCHSAIVAREYGIPAVVGTGMATTVIQDGQLVEVDGNRGLVRILQSA